MTNNDERGGGAISPKKVLERIDPLARNRKSLYSYGVLLFYGLEQQTAEPDNSKR